MIGETQRPSTLWDNASIENNGTINLLRVYSSCSNTALRCQTISNENIHVIPF